MSPIKVAFVLMLTFVGHPSLAQQAADLVAPESGLKVQHSNAIKAKEFIVASAHPEATKAGYQVLENGGNAIDAMVAVQTVLGLVEPQSSGLGGGAFLVYYDAKSQKLRTFDGRETAPELAPTDLFMADDAQPMKFFDAVVGGRSVGTPGTPKLLWDVHKKLGRTDWSKLLAPAIALASNGFVVTPRLANAVQRDEQRLKHDLSTYSYFYPEQKPVAAGALLKNFAYANTLTKLAKYGGDYFYSEAFAQSVVNKVRNTKNPGKLSIADFKKYRVIEREPSCMGYNAYRVCGMGPPSSGAISVNQTLGILENTNISALGPNSPQAWQLLAEASRLAFADRGAYLADPDFVPYPDGLLSKEYLAHRSKLIQPNHSAAKYDPGMPEQPYLNAPSPEQESTTHFVIVDKEGNIVSMTSTIENGFGSRLMVNGFLLNNELTDFSFAPEKDGKLVANRVEAGKRPRSSMAPTIVFKDQNPLLAIGSPGGSRIIPYVAKSLIAILDWNMDIQSAFNLPHIVNRFGTMDLEKNTPATDMGSIFEEMGYQVSIRDLNSGLHGVYFSRDGIMTGAADPRREGAVMGR